MKGGVLRWQNMEIEGSEMSEPKVGGEDKTAGARGNEGESRGEESWSVR